MSQHLLWQKLVCKTPQQKLLIARGVQVATRATESHYSSDTRNCCRYLCSMYVEWYLQYQKGQL